jgi:TonB-dependent SusC/RagA subfamily outer membrane receptor
MKTKIISYLFASLCVTVFSFAVVKENGFIVKLKALLQAYSEKMPGEKIYLHLDKPIYKPGDDIWFTAYLVSGAENRPSSVSNVVYVELLSPKGAVVRNLALFARNGCVNGDFRLNPQDEGGLYKIRAYTRWMKNFGEESFYGKDIPVQRYVAPRLLMKIDFEREAYGAGDSVKVTLDLRNLEDQPLVYQPVKAGIQLAGKEYAGMTFETGTDGKAYVRFILPAVLDTRDGLLLLVIDYKGRSESVSRAIPIVLNNITLDFFPEGGNLVAYVPSRLAFKAVNEFGKPADVSGVIYDPKGIPVASFRSFHDGMGAVGFTPEAETEYYAVITIPGGIEKKYPLPTVHAEGFVMTVKKQQEEKLDIAVYSPEIGTGYLVLQIAGKDYFTAEMQLKKGENGISVSTRDIPMGIARITFFNSNEYPECERLVFVNREKGLKISVKTDNDTYAPREMVKMDIETRDSRNRPVSASVSLAVTTDKIITMADDRQDNILSGLLLSSEVKGKIYEPAYYFNDEEPDAGQALDYLLMTQEWRRFAWKEVIERNYYYRYYPERNDVISGQVIDNRNKAGIPCHMLVSEWGSSNRIAEFETDGTGHFIITDADPTQSLTLYARAIGRKNLNLRIIVDGGKDEYFSGPIKYTATHTNVIPEIITPEVQVEEKPDAPAPKMSGSMSLSEDIQALDEVVVVGYGTQKRSDLTGAVVSVQRDELASPGTIDGMLAGRASGVTVLENSNNNGASTDVKIRGTASIQGTSPLIVIDGFPYEELSTGSLSSIPVPGADQVERVEILKGPAAASIYGCRGSNGVILVTIKRDIEYGGYWQNPRYRTQYYVGMKKQGTWKREFYCPVYEENVWPEKRTDFRETIFWKGGIITSSDGKAQVTFYNSDEVTTFRTVAEGISSEGFIGRTEYTYTTQKPVELDAKIPSFVSISDTINLNLVITNKMGKPVSDILRIHLDNALQLLERPDTLLSLAPGETRSCRISLKAVKETPHALVSIKFGKGKYRDEISRTMEIFQTGFPYQTSLSGECNSKTFRFDSKNAIEGTLQCNFVAYPSVIENLLSGIESIIREPYGCFEQTSASTYPNIMVLQYLRNCGKSKPAVERRAMDYIEQGYRRLVSFETSQGGFEWFGHTPPHEGLTAYGLLEFTEMQKVYPGVSDKLIARTRQWLLDRRDGKGNFRCDPGKYGFSGAGQKVTNAYLLYALSEAGSVFTDLQREYKKAFEEALSSGDAYRMALMANTAINFRRTNDADMLLVLLTTAISKDGPGGLTAEQTIVHSYGKSAQVETASLMMLALLKSKNMNDRSVVGITKFLAESRSYGGFGSTQATILALKAITNLDLVLRNDVATGSLAVTINDQRVFQQSFVKGESDSISAKGLENYLVPGVNEITVSFDSSGAVIPYSFDLGWKAITPQRNSACKVSLVTNVEKDHVNESETVRLSTLVTNKTNDVLPMTVVLVGIPGGLTPQPWQLKKLQEERVFDYYELQKNYLVFYFTELGPSEVKTINLDLKADVPGVFRSPASSAYLYYCNENKDWTDGERVIIGVRNP